MYHTYPLIKTPAALNISSMAALPYSPQLERRFWFEPEFEEGEPINLSVRHGKYLLVPRNCVTVNESTAVAWTKGSPLKSPIRMNKGVRPRNAVQERILFESSSLLDQGESHIMQASTGLGKTVLGCFLIVHVQRPTLIVVTKEDLLAQWRLELKKFLNIKDDDIGIIQQNKCDVKGKKVCIGMVHSLAKDKYPEWIKDYFGFVIFDEVHRMAATTFHTVCGMFNAELRLGLSADVNRSDRKDFVFRAHIGEVGVEAKHIAMQPKVLVVESKFRLPLVNRKTNGEWGKGQLPHSPGKMGHIIKLLTRDYQRNSLILDFIADAYDSGRNTLVLSDLARDKYLNYLHELCVIRGIPPKDIGFYVSGMKESELHDHKHRRVVLATYGMCAEAVDVPEWDTLCMATPRSNVKQPLGRVLRELSGKKQPIILDIVDNDSWVYQQYFQNRLRLYQSTEINAAIEQM